MALSDVMNRVSTEGKKSEWIDLKDGINSVRILSQPLEFRQRYFKDSKKTEICYEGCGYAGKGASLKFLCWAIDNNDALNADGTPKIKLFKMNWTIFETIVNKEKMNVAMGREPFSFPYPKDIIIMKSGEKLSTSYAVEVADQNKYEFVIDEATLAGLDKCEDVLENWKKATKERHEKEGKPVVEDESKQPDLPTIELDEFGDEIVKPKAEPRPDPTPGKATINGVEVDYPELPDSEPF